MSDRRLLVVVSDNWPDTGPGSRARKGADVSRWPVKTNTGKPPEPKDKLDTDGERT